jgi:hypothetical protein
VQDWSEDPETGKVEQQNELFAFRFANPENAAKFKEAFEKCQKGASDDMPVIKQDAEDAEKVSTAGGLPLCARARTHTHTHTRGQQLPDFARSGFPLFPCPVLLPSLGCRGERETWCRCPPAGTGLLSSRLGL